MLSFVDRGKQIDIYQGTDHATVLAALQVASQKWGVVTVTGPAEFQVLCAALATWHGFRIQNLPAVPAITQQKRSLPEATGQKSPMSPYKAHRRDIVSKAGDKEPVAAQLYDRMRVTGHSHEAIAKELLEVVTPSRALENRSWTRYARRTADAAFSARGDREVTSHGEREASWRVLEGRAPYEETRKLRPHQQAEAVVGRFERKSSGLER